MPSTGWTSATRSTSATRNGSCRRSSAGAHGLGAEPAVAARTARRFRRRRARLSRRHRPLPRLPEARDRRRRRASQRRQPRLKIDESIVVNAPAQRVYDVWHTLENLPRLLSHVERVEGLDRTRSRWTVKGPAGTRISWEAELINDKPGEVIAWRTTDSTLVNHAGSVTFEEGRLAAWPGGSTVAGQRAPIPARRHPWIPIDCPGRPCRPATTSGSSRTSRRSPSVARRPSPSR